MEKLIEGFMCAGQFLQRCRGFAARTKPNGELPRGKQAAKKYGR